MNDLPLSARVVASVALSVPRDRDFVQWRPASLDDVSGIVDLYRAMAPVDHPHYVESEEQVADQLSRASVDLGRDTLIGLSEAGSVIAFGATVLPPVQESMVRSILDGGVHPAHRGRGIGRELLAWQYGRALQQLAGSHTTLPGWVMAYADEHAPQNGRMLERLGLTLSRYFMELVRDIAEPIPMVEHDRAVRIVQYESQYELATLDAKNAAFRDHWGSQPMSQPEWTSMMSLSEFHPELSYLALAPDGNVAGFVLTVINEEDWALQGFTSGYIELVGVVRQWRRKGIAPALLAATLEAYRAAGLQTAVLDVDAESPTGALGLYTGMGFAAASRSMAYTRVF